MVRVQAAHLKASSGGRAVQQEAQEAGMLNSTECQARHAHSLNGDCVYQSRGKAVPSHPG